MRPRTTSVRSAIIVCLLLQWTACDSFLEPDPKSFSTTANFYETQEQFEAAVIGVYTRFRDLAGDDNYRHMADLRGPNVTIHFDVNLPGTVGGFPQLDEWTMTSDNGQAAGIWVNLFELVKEANVIVGRIDAVEFSDAALKERLIGEARFMRAFAFWTGVQFWGDFPLVLEEVTSPEQAMPEGGRNPVAEVYQQVVADLMDAVGKLPVSYGGSDAGRITQGAARMLLGRTYLLTGDYASALSQFQAIDASGQYSLLANYRDVFNPAMKNGAESILEIQYNPNIPGQPQNGLFSDVIPWNSGNDLSPPAVVPGGDYHPTPDVIDSYEAGDLRKDWSIGWYVKEGNNAYHEIAYGDSLPYFHKFHWLEHVNANGQGDDNWVFFRFADALLSAAEAEWRLGNSGGAMGYLNRVRDRAGLPAVNLADYSGAVTGSPLGDAVLHERSIELVGEGHYWLDLLRFGSDIALKVMIKHGQDFMARDPKIDNTFYIIDEYKFLYPIDPVEVILGGFPQNPGWV